MGTKKAGTINKNRKSFPSPSQMGSTSQTEVSGREQVWALAPPRLRIIEIAPQVTSSHLLPGWHSSQPGAVVLEMIRALGMAWRRRVN